MPAFAALGVAIVATLGSGIGVAATWTSSQHHAVATRPAPAARTTVGPQPGEGIAGYLARARAALARRAQLTPTEPTWAVVDLTEAITAGQLTPLLGGLQPDSVYTVYTAEAGRQRKTVGVRVLPGDLVKGLIAAGWPGDCACSYAAVVLGTPQALASLANDPAVRLVDLAPAGVAIDDLRFRPLFPPAPR